MSILQYLKPINGTSDLNGQLSSIVPSAAGSTCGFRVFKARSLPTVNYTGTIHLIALIATFCFYPCVASSSFSSLFQEVGSQNVSLGTVPSIMEAHIKELRKQKVAGVCLVKQLPFQMHGRPLLLGDKVDRMLATSLPEEGPRSRWSGVITDSYCC